jgi:hypothetical protein
MQLPITKRPSTGFENHRPAGRKATKREAATLARVLSHALTSKGANIAQFIIAPSRGAYQFATVTFRFPRKPVVSRRKPK